MIGFKREKIYFDQLMKTYQFGFHLFAGILGKTIAIIVCVFGSAFLGHYYTTLNGGLKPEIVMILLCSLYIKGRHSSLVTHNSKLRFYNS